MPFSACKASLSSMTIVVAMEDAVIVERDGSVAERPVDHRPACVAATDSALFCGTVDAGLLRSRDGGETWDRIAADVITDRVTAVAIDPRDPAIIWAGTEPSALFRSSDGGDTWETLPALTDLETADQWSFPPRPHTHHVRWIEPDPHEPHRLYVGIEAGALLVSADGGQTWLERPPGSRYDNHQLATHPTDPGRVYSAAGDGYAESTDFGETWAHPQGGLDHRYVWSVAPDLGDPGTVLVSAASGASAAHSQPAESYVYRRAGEADWERIDGLPTGEGVLRAVIEPVDEATFVAANNRGLFRTSDAGDTWAALDVDWADRFGDQTVRGVAVS